MKLLSSRKKQKKSKKIARLTYIDTAKSLVILSMVLGHLIIFYRGLGNNHPELLMFIYTFHMPSFFIFSGIFFDPKKWFNKSPLTFIASKFKSLIIPYLFLDITGGFINLLINQTLSIKKILGLIPKTFSMSPNISSNWFLLTLFISSIAFYYFLKYYKSWFKYLVFIPILILGFKNIILTDCLLFIFRGIIGFTFIYLGYTLKDYFLDENNKRMDIIILAFVLITLLMKWNGQIDIWACIINNPIYALIGGIVGTYFIIGLSKNIDNHIFQFVGKNTITILGTHSILIQPLYDLFGMGSGNKSLILLFIVIIMIEFPWMYIYDKYIPTLIGKKV